MEVEEYDIKIKEIESKLDALNENLEQLAEEITKKVKIFSGEWIKDTVNFTVINEANITNSLSKDQLKQLKIKCHELIEVIPNLVEKELKKDVYWKHREVLSSNDIYSYE